eukprot:SAG25_NODE_238_length_11236_cov_37.046061_9_plen_650_part_00
MATRASRTPRGASTSWPSELQLIVSEPSVRKHLDAAKVRSLDNIGELSPDGLAALTKGVRSADLAPKQRRVLADMLARADNFKRVRNAHFCRLAADWEPPHAQTPAHVLPPSRARAPTVSKAWVVAQWDDDGNGSLDMAEIEAAIRASFSRQMCKMIFANGKLKETFNQIDADGDGTISFAEFYAHCGQNQLLYGLMKNDKVTTPRIGGAGGSSGSKTPRLPAIKGAEPAPPTGPKPSSGRQGVGGSSSHSSSSSSTSSGSRSSRGRAALEPEPEPEPEPAPEPLMATPPSAPSPKGARPRRGVKLGAVKKAGSRMMESAPMLGSSYGQHGTDSGPLFRDTAPKGSATEEPAAQPEPVHAPADPKPKPKKLRRGRSLGSLTGKMAQSDPGFGGKADAETGRRSSVLSLEEKFAAYESSQNVLDKLMGSKDDVGVEAPVHVKKEEISPQMMERANRVLLRVPESREKAHVKELSMWMDTIDLFHGLTSSQRQELCLKAVGKQYLEDTPIICAGDMNAALHVVFAGRAAVYLSSTGEDGAFDGNRAKLKAGSTRRESIAGRRSSVTDGGRRDSVAAKRKTKAELEKERAGGKSRGHRSDVAGIGVKRAMSISDRSMSISDRRLSTATGADGMGISMQVRAPPPSCILFAAG